MRKNDRADEDESLKSEGEEDDGMLDFLPEDSEFDEGEDLDDELDAFDMDDGLEDDGEGDEEEPLDGGYDRDE